MQASGIRGDPFASVPDPKFTFQHEGFRRLAAELLFSRMSDRRGLALVEGLTGSGKTTLLVHLAADSKLASGTLSIAAHDRLRPVQLIDLCCRALSLEESDLPAGDDLDVWVETFAKAVASRKRREGSLLLLVDRGEHLSEECVDCLIMLSDIKLGGRKLVHPILTLDSEDENMPLPDAFSGQETAIAFRYWLGPMAASEVGEYVRHRLKRVGYRGDELFPDEAIEELARCSGALPGRINAICKEILSEINASLANQASKELILRITGTLGFDSLSQPVIETLPDTLPAPEPEKVESNVQSHNEGTSLVPGEGAWDLSVDDLVPDLEEVIEEAEGRGRPNRWLQMARSVVGWVCSTVARLSERSEESNRVRWIRYVLVGSVLTVGVFTLAFMGGRLLGPESPGDLERSIQATLPSDLELQVSELSERLSEVEQERDRLEQSLAASQVMDDEVSAATAESLPTDETVSLETQKALSKLGYDPGPLDGDAKGKTRAAIRRYQEDHRLAVTGEPSPSLLAHMIAFQRLKDAVVLYHEKDYSGAVAAYDAVLELQPKDPEARMYRALALLQLGQYASGITDFQDLAGQVESVPAARFPPARVYYIQERLRSLGFDTGRIDGRFDEATAKAIEAYQRVQGLPLDAMPSLSLLQHLEAYRFHVDAIMAYRKGEIENAIEIYSLVLTLAPDDPQAFFNRGLAFKRLGRLREARQDYDNAIVLNPRMAKAYYDRGNIFLAEGQYIDALKDYARAISRWAGIS